MKLQKIILICLPLILIIGAVIYFFSKKPSEIIIPNAPNSFVTIINNEISQLSKTPNNTFCETKYRLILNEISTYALAGKIDSVWKENLQKNLDYIYTPIFISQANYVFNNTDWEINKLNVIRSEVNMLTNSKYISNKSELSDIKNILTKYDEISSFILQANAFSNISGVSFYGQNFEIDKVKKYIDEANNIKLNNSLVNRCTRLNIALQEIPSLMYSKNYNYLMNKVQFCKNRYQAMQSYDEWYDAILKSIFIEFQNFEDNYAMYSVPSSKPVNDLISLKDQMDEERTNAQDYNYINR